MKTKKAPPLYVLLLAGFVVYGVLMSVFGATVPRLVGELHWSYTTTGIVLAASSVGFFFSTFASGLLLEGSSPKGIYIAAVLLAAAAIALFGRLPSPFLNAVLCLAIGVAQGVIEVVTNYETVRMEKAGQSRHMTMLHAAFSVGAIAGPLAIGAVTRMGVPWRAAFPSVGFLLTLVAFAAAFWRFSPPERGAHHGAAGGIALMRQPVLILFSIAMICSVGSQIGTTNWVAEYFVSVLDSAPSTGAYAVSVLWIGLLAGRSLLSVVKRGGGSAAIIIMLSLFCTASLLAFMAVRTVIPGMALVFALGLGYSGIYPLIITLAGQTFRSSAAVGMMSTAGGVGSFTFPFLLAATSQAVGLQRGFLVPALLPLGIAAAIAAASRLARRPVPGGRPLSKEMDPP